MRPASTFWIIQLSNSRDKLEHYFYFLGFLLKISGVIEDL